MGYIEVQQREHGCLMVDLIFRAKVRKSKIKRYERNLILQKTSIKKVFILLNETSIKSTSSWLGISVDGLIGVH